MFEIASALINTLGETINEKLDDYTQAQVMTLTLAAVFTYQAASQLPAIYRGRHNIHIKRDLMAAAMRLFEYIPGVSGKIKAEINKEVSKTLADINKDIQKARKRYTAMKTLSEKGMPPKDILDRYNHFQDDHHAYKFSGAEYVKHPEQLMDLLAELFKLTAYSNPLHSDWPLLSLMEAEIIAWCQDLFGGTVGGPGIMTHGGTTSIIESVNAYVQHKRKLGVKTPEIVVPASAHVAFIKAARLTGAKLIVVPVDKISGKVDPDYLKTFISSNTAMIVGSAPSFMYGVADDIAELGKIAKEKGIGLHVDACLGGFVTAFDERTDQPKYDFSVDGVTSISCDTHKYGYAPKGSSILLFKKGCPYYTESIDLEWSGGMYVTKGILDGSRSGVPIATTHAVMSYYGLRHYKQVTKSILDLSQNIMDKVKHINGIHVHGDSKLMVVGIRSNTYNIHVICDQMKKHGWSLSRLQNPDGFHLCITQVHTQKEGFADEFLIDLVQSVAYAKSHPNEKPKGEAKAYGKFKQGVPLPVQEQIGRGYVHLHNTVGLVKDNVDATIAEKLAVNKGPLIVTTYDADEELRQECRPEIIAKP